MTTQEILNSSLNKTQKALRLFDLGHTRAEVAEWITNGNYGFAYNIWKKWNETHSVIDQSTLSLPFEFTFNRSFGIELEVYGTSRDALLREIRRSVIANDEDIRATDEHSFVEDLINHFHIEVL